MADKIPDLDDLLKSIRDEGKPQSSSALAVIPKAEKKGTDIVDEDIDPIILRLLGLEDTFDIDYDTYKTLLREKMAAGRMPGSSMPTEEVELLTNEFKRVKGKTGRFKVKAQKIKAESFVAKKKEPAAATKAVKALPEMKGPKPPQIKPAVEPKEEKVDQSMKLLADKISDVNDNIKKVTDTDLKKDKLDRKKDENRRIQTEKTRKTIREERAERGKMSSGLSNALGSAIAPVKGVLDIIGDFLKRFLVGTAIMELIKFLENPQSYINGIVNWLNGVIEKVESGIRDIVKNTIIAPINNVIGGVNGGIKSMVDQINGLIGKIPGNVIPKMDLSKMQIGTIDPSVVDNVINLPRIPAFGGTAQPSTQSGQQAARPTQTATASASATGGPAGFGQDFATLATIAALESGSAQGRADVAQSVYNRLADKLYGKSITDILTRQGQYQVAFKDPTSSSGPGTQVAAAFKNIKTEDDAVKAIMYYYKARGQSITSDRARKMYRESAAAISDPNLRKKSAQFVGGRTEFRGYRTGTPGEVHRGSGSDNYFSVQYGSGKQMSRGAAAVPTALLNAPPQTTQPATAAKPAASVTAAKPSVTPPAAPGSGGLSSLPIPVSTGAKQSNQSSVTTPNQKSIPTFSAYDKSNPSYLVIKSIYNIVG